MNILVLLDQKLTSIPFALITTSLNFRNLDTVRTRTVKLLAKFAQDTEFAIKPVLVCAKTTGLGTGVNTCARGTNISDIAPATGHALSIPASKRIHIVSAIGEKQTIGALFLFSSQVNYNSFFN